MAQCFIQDLPSFFWPFYFPKIFFFHIFWLLCTFLAQNRTYNLYQFVVCAAGADAAGGAGELRAAGVPAGAGRRHAGQHLLVAAVIP